MILLDTAKSHLRVTHAREDSLIAIYLDAAVEHCEMWCDRTFGSEMPKSVQAAALLVLGDLFENREGHVMANLQKNATAEALLQPYRRYGFGLPETAQAPLGLDSEVMFIGDEWSRQWAYKNDDGTAINVTGYAGTFELLSGETVVHSGALTLSNAVGGLFFYSLPDLSSVITAGDYWYRVRVAPSGGKPTTIDRKMVIAQ